MFKPRIARPSWFESRGGRANQTFAYRRRIQDASTALVWFHTAQPPPRCAFPGKKPASDVSNIHAPYLLPGPPRACFRGLRLGAAEHSCEQQCWPSAVIRRHSPLCGFVKPRLAVGAPAVSSKPQRIGKDHQSDGWLLTGVCSVLQRFKIRAGIEWAIVAPCQPSRIQDS